ncbi:MAG: TIGR04168 family protein [Elainellaceae cyanobacterium]
MSQVHPQQSADPPNSITIAVVGDVHDLWDDGDRVALEHLGADLVLFMGDFGNESVDIVRQIAQVPLPKAAIMGNHDAWYHATDWGRKRCPYDMDKENRVAEQLDLLGSAHVGYSQLDFPQFDLTVVGGRPFSWGGKKWKHRKFYKQWFDIGNFEESYERIRASVDAAAHSTVIFIGHCGPSGLGDRPEDPCGRDWKPSGGDYGDPDLQRAIAYAQAQGRTVPLVAFGHMHHRLRHRQDRLREHLTVIQETVYLNGAYVPRIITEGDQQRRHFSLVTLTNQQVSRVEQVWVDQAFNVEATVEYSDRVGDASTDGPKKKQPQASQTR